MDIQLQHGGVMPKRAHVGDAGLDCHANAEVTIPSGRAAMVPLGFKVAIPDGHVGLLVGRSGLGVKHGIRLANSVGIIDAGYRGEVMACLHNDGRAPFYVRPGDRVAQLLVMPIALPALNLVNELMDSDRGENGFGSTGWH